MTNFHPSKISRIVFDLDSISVSFDNEAWQNFRNFLLVLEERDYEIILISKAIDIAQWEKHSRISILQTTCEEAYQKNYSLFNTDVFWISENPSLHKKLSNSTRNFAGSNSLSSKNGGLQYQSLYDLLQIFHPSKVTSTDLSKDLIKIKLNSERIPLLVGIGGPEDCGHSFFVGELVEALEDQKILVSSLDLTQVIGLEFLKNNREKLNNSNSYWHSKEIKDWVLEEVINPYAQGKSVYFEKPPKFLEEFEITIFPFFLAPEMILLIWGTTIFLNEFEKLFDVRILLELTDKTAAARMFGIDERQNFDKKFVESYLTKDGKSYYEYFRENKVIEKIDYIIDFNNFYAFRFKD